MISVEDCEFIKKFEVASSEEKQVILTNEGHQVRSAEYHWRVSVFNGLIQQVPFVSCYFESFLSPQSSAQKQWGREEKKKLQFCVKQE